MAGAQSGSTVVAAVNTLFTVEPKILEDNPEVLLCCIDASEFPIQFSGVSCIEVVTRQCHIAVPGDPTNVRRLCLMPDRDADSVFAGVPSPVKVRIKSSSTIKFYCSKDATKEEVQGTLLWEVEVLPTDRTTLPPWTDDIPQDLPHDMHLQPLSNADHCNCKTATQPAYIIVDMTPDMQQDPLAGILQDIDLSDVGSCDSAGDTDSEEQDDSTPILSGQIFSVAGSTWQAYYQDALQKCASLRRNGTDVEMRTVFEPDNIKDKNAIKIEVFVDDSWQIVGYCPGPKVPKLTRALNKGEVTETSLHKITFKYCIPAKQVMHYAFVKIVKKGNWEKDCFSYKYNSVIAT